MQQQAAPKKGTRQSGGPRAKRFEPIGRNVRILQERAEQFPRIDHTNAMEVLAWTEQQFREAIDEAGS